WNNWEEQNIAPRGGFNFGWPCYEGLGQQSAYTGLNPPRAGCSTIGSASNPGSLKTGVFTWHHGSASISTPPGIVGNCSIGGVFYTDSLYPSTYRSRYFFGDFAANWIK